MQQRLTKVVLLGSPNVGKSLIFNHLTGTYVSVSNYPGTTVDIARGPSKIGGKQFEIIDTPGIYSLIPLTDEERVTRELLRTEQPDIVVHVVDAKNIRRMLSLTLQLLDAGLPVILNLNIMDEAQQNGMYINTAALSALLGVPVIATSAVKKLGLEQLRRAIRDYQQWPARPMAYAPEIEQAINAISGLLSCDYGMSPRLAALLLLQGDQVTVARLHNEPLYEQIVKVWQAAGGRDGGQLSFSLAHQRQQYIETILRAVLRVTFKSQHHGIAARLGCWTRQPLTGVPILCLVLYFGLYKFVGQFGAGYLVDYIDSQIFGAIINPFVVELVQAYIPTSWLQSLIVGDYGVYSLGFRYAVAIILPIVGTFFLVFAILEDSGYLPRLAMLVDRLFKNFGLNGRAVIPIALGLGCGTMAVVVTRTLETRRERVLATFLLSLTIPCSAQLGVVLALLAHNTQILVLWVAYVAIIFVSVGWLSAKVLPGDHSPFYLEIPPLRCPQFTNVIIKAYTRMATYFWEIMPVFVATSVIMWLGDYTGLLASLISAIEPIVNWLGLPTKTAAAFLLGFFRRDYGAAGLYEMTAAGLLSDSQLLIAAVTLTLFVPCIAQLTVMVKERSLITSILMVLLITAISLLSGRLMYVFLSW